MTLAFHGKASIKEEYLARVAAHEKSDEIVKGLYWEKGKGCAVGCTVHSGDHIAYEIELGIPMVLAQLEDRIFEGAPNAWSKKFPKRFLNAINPGADLSGVWAQFAQWMLTDPDKGVARFATEATRTAIAISNVSAAYGRGETSLEKWRQLRADAAAARAAAYRATAYAAGATNDDAYRATAYAADAAAASAYATAYAYRATAYAAGATAYAYRATAYAAGAAAYAADAAAYAAGATAYRAARAAYFQDMGEKLLQLLKATK